MEPHRYYHNLQHIHDMLLNDNLIINGLTIWYHDAIYDPKRNDNEERSAELAESELKDYIDNDDLKTIMHGILLTKHQ